MGSSAEPAIRSRRACTGWPSTWTPDSTALGIEHVFEDYGNGSHTWPYWQDDLRTELPLLMATFADPPAPPTRFSYVAIEDRYERLRLARADRSPYDGVQRP